MMESGLVTLEKARVLQYGKKRSSYMGRFKKGVRERMHLSGSPQTAFRPLNSSYNVSLASMGPPAGWVFNAFHRI